MLHAVTGTAFKHLAYTVPVTERVRYPAYNGRFVTSCRSKENERLTLGVYTINIHRSRCRVSYLANSGNLQLSAQGKIYFSCSNVNAMDIISTHCSCYRASRISSQQREKIATFL